MAPEEAPPAVDDPVAGGGCRAPWCSSVATIDPGTAVHLDADILTRHLPVGYQRFQFFACGPNPMLDAVETALVKIGTPADRIHTERSDWVSRIAIATTVLLVLACLAFGTEVSARPRT